MLGRCDGTFTTVRREMRQVIETNDDRYFVAPRNSLLGLASSSSIAAASSRCGRARSCCSSWTSRSSPPMAPAASVSPTCIFRWRRCSRDGARRRGTGGARARARRRAVACSRSPATCCCGIPRRGRGGGPSDRQLICSISQRSASARAASLSSRRPAWRLCARCGSRPCWIILQERFAEPDFSAQKLAAAAGLSERYVNELLYDAGASFTIRLNELRMRKAADLLMLSRERRISDIAFECGFNDLSYFNRCFRRRFGLTPSGGARGGGFFGGGGGGGGGGVKILCNLCLASALPSDGHGVRVPQTIRYPSNPQSTRGPAARPARHSTPGARRAARSSTRTAARSRMGPRPPAGVKRVSFRFPPCGGEPVRPAHARAAAEAAGGDRQAA